MFGGKKERGQYKCKVGNYKADELTSVVADYRHGISQTMTNEDDDPDYEDTYENYC